MILPEPVDLDVAPAPTDAPEAQVRAGAMPAGGKAIAGHGSPMLRNIVRAAVVAAAAAGAYLLWSVFGKPDPASSPMVGVFTQITTQTGREAYPSLSP